ncbi:MAG: glycosyltransferase [Candidatus Staskawiczbacteria bacterium]|nr:glycosyltransferase [Candidatus Staskawiczbacteria bacterium]
MSNKYCLIYNFYLHYREGIFVKMDTELGCDFYFGDRLDWAPGIKGMDLNMLRGFKKVLKNIKVFKYFTWQEGSWKLVLKDYKYYILYGDPSYLSNWIILILAKITGKKTYIWTHGLYQDLNWKSKIINYPFYYFATKILLYGDYSKNIMVKRGFKVNKLLCIYNSLDHENMLLLRKKLETSKLFSNFFKNEYPVLIYIGRIQKSKKVEYVLSALSILRSKGVFVNLIVVGEDNENVNLFSIAEKLNLQNYIWMYGPCYNEEILSQLIYNSDVCVSPGNIGLTAMHTLSYGTPAITHSNFKNQMPEFEAIMPGFTGDFFLEDDVDDLVLTIRKWINLDIKLREKIRENCYKVIDERYNPAYQIKIFKSMIYD